MTQKKNMKKNREMFETVCGSTSTYVVNPVLVVCPICETKRFLNTTGNMWEFMEHLKYFKGDDGHKELLQAFTEAVPYAGLVELKPYNASSHPSYME